MKSISQGLAAPLPFLVIALPLVKDSVDFRREEATLVLVYESRNCILCLAIHLHEFAFDLVDLATIFIGEVPSDIHDSLHLQLVILAKLLLHLDSVISQHHLLKATSLSPPDQCLPQCVPEHLFLE